MMLKAAKKSISSSRSKHPREYLQYPGRFCWQYSAKTRRLFPKIKRHENAVDTKRLRRLIINCLRTLVGGRKADRKTKYLANKINQTLFLDNILSMRPSQVLPENWKADPGTTIQFC